MFVSGGDGAIGSLSSSQVGGWCHCVSVIIPGRGDGVIGSLSSSQVGGWCHCISVIIPGRGGCKFMGVTICSLVISSFSHG